MKGITIFIGILLTLFILAAGRMHWNHRTNVSLFSSSEKAPASTKSDVKPEKESNQKLFEQTKNWPERAQKSFRNAVTSGKKFKVALVGSKAIGSETNGMAKKLKKALLDQYGEHMEVSIFSYNVMSNHFLGEKKDQDVLKFKPDMVLFEPFILNDSGNLKDVDMHKNISTFIDEIKEQNKDAVVILQPAQPLYQATYYPKHVKSLKAFAEKNQIPYLDHWKAWPNSDTAELKKDLTPDENVPSDKGVDIWFHYLENYFIAK